MLQPSADATLSCAFVKRIKSTQTLLLYTLPEDWNRKRELEGSHSIKERGSGTVVERRAVGGGGEDGGRKRRKKRGREGRRKGEGGIMVESTESRLRNYLEGLWLGKEQRE